MDITSKEKYEKTLVLIIYSCLITACSAQTYQINNKVPCSKPRQVEVVAEARSRAGGVARLRMQHWRDPVRSTFYWFNHYAIINRCKWSAKDRV